MSDSVPPNSALEGAGPAALAPPSASPTAQGGDDAYSWDAQTVGWDPFLAGVASQETKKPRGRRRKDAAFKCQVAGCQADLSILKAYHQRYKICELHLKAHCIVRDDIKQRFCQQCGRFHEMGAFVAGTRSCRESLARHNARRRKFKRDDDEEQDAGCPGPRDPLGADAAMQPHEGGFSRAKASIGSVVCSHCMSQLRATA
jgi:hypothetical protein